MVKEIKQDQNQQRDILFSCIGRFNKTKVSILPQITCRFNVVHIKIKANFFSDIDKFILKFIWNNTDSKIAKAILEKKNKVLGISLLNLHTYVSTVIKNVQYWWRDNAQINQWNRILNPETDPHKDAQHNSDKDTETIQWKDDGLLNK